MPTTPRGIVYPDSAGHTRLWEHLQAQADSVDTAIGAAVTDTGWVPLVFRAGFTSLTGYDCVIRQYGPVIMLRGRVAKVDASNIAASDSQITPADFPGGFTQGRPVSIPQVTSTLGKYARIICTDGAVTIANAGSTSWASIDLTFGFTG